MHKIMKRLTVFLTIGSVIIIGISLHVFLENEQEPPREETWQHGVEISSRPDLIPIDEFVTVKKIYINKTTSEYADNPDMP